MHILVNMQKCSYSCQHVRTEPRFMKENGTQITQSLTIQKGFVRGRRRQSDHAHFSRNVPFSFIIAHCSRRSVIRWKSSGRHSANAGHTLVTHCLGAEKYTGPKTRGQRGNTLHQSPQGFSFCMKCDRNFRNYMCCSVPALLQPCWATGWTAVSSLVQC